MYLRVLDVLEVGVGLALDTGGALWLDDGSLWFKKNQETGSYELFIVTNGRINGNTIYRATLDWAVPETAKYIAIQQLAAGLSHSLALKADGTVWAWGSTGPYFFISPMPGRRRSLKISFQLTCWKIADIIILTKSGRPAK